MQSAADLYCIECGHMSSEMCGWLQAHLLCYGFLPFNFFICICVCGEGCLHAYRRKRSCAEVCLRRRVLRCTWSVACGCCHTRPTRAASLWPSCKRSPSCRRAPSHLLLPSEPPLPSSIFTESSGCMHNGRPWQLGSCQWVLLQPLVHHSWPPCTTQTSNTNHQDGCGLTTALLLFGICS